MRHIILIGFACLVVACAEDGSSTDDDDPINCATVTTDDDFVVGLVKPGENATLDFTIMSGDPAPPIRGDNTWVVQVTTNGAATPVADASIIVTPFMPLHGHGAGKSVDVSEMPGSIGQYKLTPVNLWMPGVWEITVDATSTNGDDTVLFSFCIPS